MSEAMKLFTKTRFLAVAVGTLLTATSVQAAQTITITRLASPPSVDGELGEWGDSWQSVHLKPAKDGDNKNFTGELDVELQVGVAGDEIFFAARWPDAKAHTDYKPWKWKKSKYKRGKQRDDMFALRFDMGGDFNTCMIEDADYKVDVWLWSAGRSNEMGYATDMWQQISLSPIEDAAEYDTPSGQVVYIKKSADDGVPGFKNNKPNRKKNQGDRLPGVLMTAGATGSLADVTAKGVWKDGFWTLELKRKLDTGHIDDVVLAGIGSIKGQVAFFNKGYAEHKSVSGELSFDFSGL
jgi:hypothetical protein